MHDVDILRLILSKGLARNGRENARNGRKKARNGREKKKVPLDPLVLTVMTCRVFLKTLFTHGPNRRHGPKRRRRHVVLSLWGACCSLSLASSSIAPFSSWNGFISVLLGLPVRMFLDFAACSVHLIYVMYLYVVTVVFLCWMLNVERPAWGFFVWKKHARLLMWCCENCAIAEGCLLEVSWPFLAYFKHTWCWGGYFRFTLSKARLFTCAAMQPMLSGVAVRGRIWHAAHALARDKSVLSSLWGKNQVDYYGEPRNFGHLFFQTLKRAHFLKSGRKKMVHIFVYQWEVQVYIYCVCVSISPFASIVYIYIYIHAYLFYVHTRMFIQHIPELDDGTYTGPPKRRSVKTMVSHRFSLI